MKPLTLPQDAIVFVGDGRKALVLRNIGDAMFPNLRKEQVFSDHNPATHEQGSDKPGRSFNSGDSRRSAMDNTDWHDIEEHRFARFSADALEALVRAQKTKAVVLVAPPRTLADLRDALHADIKARVIAEIDKDLTKHPISEIEKHLVG